MNATESRRDARVRHWYRERDCSLQDFVAALQPRSDGGSLRFATETVDHVPVYDCRVLGSALEDASRRADLHAEWANVLNVGAGVLVLKQAYADTAPVDEATEVFELVIREEREAGGAVADHFAKLGANDRIWNAQQKLCLRAPSVFARYFANSAPCAMPEAWLGPHFQVTSQVNVVRPRGDGLKNRTGRNGAQLISMVQGCKRLRVRLSPVPNGSRTLPGQRSESPFVRNSGRLSRAPSALWRTSVAPCAAD